VTPDQIRDLQRAGMVVGSHSVTHPVFSKLEEPAEREEIVNSFDFLEEATGGAGSILSTTPPSGS
jgi:peptidoglycan/xylan/chitin deacetylase (PgdA/CDA1 family)